MYRALSLSVAIFAAAGAGTALADSPKLKGEYGFTGTGECLTAPGSANSPSGTNPSPGVALPNSGFQPNLRPKDALAGNGPQNSFSHSWSVIGIRTFNGDGTGTVKGTVVGVTARPTPGPNPTFPNFAPSAGTAEFSFSFTYTVDGDGGWTSAMVPGSYLQNHLTGPRTGQTSTIDAIPPFAGLVSNDGKTLIAAHTTPDVEVHTYSNGDVWPEICHRARVFIALPKGK